MSKLENTFRNFNPLLFQRSCEYLARLGFYDQGINELASQRNKLETDLRIAVVCKGNICRSPFAEHRLRKLMIEKKLVEQKQLSVTSAGLHTTPGKPADPTAISVSVPLGIDLSSHKTTQVSPQLCESTDVFVVFEPWQAHELWKKYKVHRSRIVLLGRLVDPSWNHTASIADPFGRSAEAFQKCYAQIDICIKKLLDMLIRN